MFTVHPDFDTYCSYPSYDPSYDPFHAWKYEQEMRRRKQAVAEQYREHEAFLQQRRRQQEEAFQRNKAKQNYIRQMQYNQQQGYQVVQDWDGQLYLVPPYQSSLDRMNTNPTNYENDTANESLSAPVDVEDRKTARTIPVSNVAMNDPSDNRKVATVLVEDVSDSEEDDDMSSTLKKNLRNRRPSPGQWIEPVEMMV